MRRLRTYAAALVAFAAIVFAGPAYGQAGSVSGEVRNAETGAPVSGALVFIEGTAIRHLTGADGRFGLSGVPAGERSIRVRVIGYVALSQPVMVRAGETTTLTLTLTPQAIALTEIVVTGTVGETPRAKLPIDVAQLRAADLPVSSPNFASAIQGKIAGATVVQSSGRPGSAPSVLLRGATSIGSQGRDQEPLYIVDGVILGSSVVDIDALDIEQIEVVKGAAAASLYGSRAANGVVQITTRRGNQFQDGQVRYTFRSSLGVSDLPGRFPLLQTHQWAMDGNRFIDATTNTPCDFRGTPNWNPNPDEECSGNMRTNGTTAWNTYAVGQWPGGAFDHVGMFYDGGAVQEHYASASGRQGATNFHVSFSRTDDQGPMLGQDGFRRNNFRLNLDQVVRPTVHVSASAFYSRSVQEGFPEGSGNPVFALTRMPAGVDLRWCEPGTADSPIGYNFGSDTWTRTNCLDDPQNLLINVNPVNTESPNPLYELLVRQNDVTRGRFLASSNLRWSLTNFFDVDAAFSYDRLDSESNSLRPKGFRTVDPSPTINNGTLSIANSLREAFNASVTGSLRWQVTDQISNRTSVRWLYEQQDIELNDVGGHTFGAEGVHSVDNLNTETLFGGSSRQSVRADGYFVITNFDLYDRYIIDALLRNDGSSLFGADERRQWYGRIAAAWRISEESWLNIGVIDEMKLRYSLGTAGGRPNFFAQYETFSVAGGTILPITLGNRLLKPEHATEHEMGVDVAFGNRFDFTGTYAQSKVDNQILQVPLPAFMGFGSQWQNVGTLESKTWELSLGARLVTTPSFNWSARILYDRNRSVITELNRPPFRFGVAGQNMGNVFMAREGERMGTFYGPIPARSCDQLPDTFAASCDEFRIDDNGFLVWVGPGGSLSDPQWGTALAGHASAIGAPVMWGTPFAGQCTDRVSNERTNFCPVGNTMPDYRVGLSSTIEFKGFSLYGLIDAEQGFDVWNQPLSWAVFRRNVDMYDQSGVPENDRKPLGYFDATYGGLSGLVPNGEYVEDASYVKLREISLRYRVTGAQLEGIPLLRGFHGIALSASGRNLKTWSSYRGYDPEVGRAGGAVGSAAIARVDGFNYPNFRTWTFAVEVTF